MNDQPPNEIMLPKDVHPDGKPLARYAEMSNSYGFLYRQAWQAEGDRDGRIAVAYYRRQRQVWGACSEREWYRIYHSVNLLED